MITFSSAISILKNAQALAEKLKNRELNDALLSLQQELIGLGNQNLELKEKYDELKKYLEIPNDVYLDNDGFICRKNDTRKYCPHCWNKYRKFSLMPLEGVEVMDYLNLSKPYMYKCSACGHGVQANKAYFKN